MFGTPQLDPQLTLKINIVVCDKHRTIFTSVMLFGRWFKRARERARAEIIQNDGYVRLHWPFGGSLHCTHRSWFIFFFSRNEVHGEVIFRSHFSIVLFHYMHVNHARNVTRNERNVKFGPTISSSYTLYACHIHVWQMACSQKYELRILGLRILVCTPMTKRILWKVL